MTVIALETQKIPTFQRRKGNEGHLEIYRRVYRETVFGTRCPTERLPGEQFLCVISIDSRGRIYFMISLHIINIKIISNLNKFFRIIETYDYARRDWSA